jgi:hypothetical protein
MEQPYRVSTTTHNSESITGCVVENVLGTEVPKGTANSWQLSADGLGSDWAFGLPDWSVLSQDWHEIAANLLPIDEAGRSPRLTLIPLNPFG